jgi:hypothetical protein
MLDSTVKYGMSLLVLLVLFGCASSPKPVTSDATSSDSRKIDETFDPLSLKDEDIVFPQPKQLDKTEQPSYLPAEKTVPAESLQVENKQLEGFRLQLLSTKDLESATRSKAMAQEQFSDLQLKFYLEFDSPYYKVRTGDFKTRQEAESMRGIVRSRGYPQAWIVKTKIWSNPEFPAVEDSSQLSTPEIN